MRAAFLPCVFVVFFGAAAAADEASPVHADGARTEAPAITPSASPRPAPILLALFQTHYLRDAEHRARAFNVELAASAIDGQTLAPGATFSFNRVVGERTKAFGFQDAQVLRDQALAEGTGGGACQVASALHAAALLGGLAIVERAPHSRPSAYIPMGLDATVVYPSVDLKLRNPRTEEVRIRARAMGGQLAIAIEAAGGERRDVSVTSEIVERIPFPRTVERDASLAPHTVRVKAYGIPGFRVRRTREVRAENGSIRRDERTDVYPPTPEVFAVAPDFDVRRLDPLAASTEEEDDTVYDTRGASRPDVLQLLPKASVTLTNRD